MLRRRSLARAFAALLGAALCAAPASDAWAGNVTQQPSASGPTWTWTWPSTAGTSGYVLTTDGSGITSWTAPGGLGLTLSLSSITAATTTNGIDNGAYAQIWTWNSLTTGTALSLTSSTETSGKLLSVGVTNPAATGYAGYFSQAGTGTSYGLYSTNASRGSGYGIYASITGANNSGYGLYALNNSANGWGIYGYGPNNIGVNGAGVFGVYGISVSATAGASGVYAFQNSVSGQTYGVQAWDFSPSGYAVYGLNVATTGNARGVYGETNSTTSGRAVEGKQSGAGNSGYGGRFSNAATSGVNYGVYGTDASGSGYGGFFTNTGTGWALAATGTSYLNGNVGIGTTGPATALDVNGDITNRNVTSCAQLGTDSSGKLVCQTPAMSLVSVQSASNSASLSWTGLTGSDYILICKNMIAATGGQNLNIQFGQGAGPTWQTIGYNWTYPYGAVSGSTPSTGASGDTDDVGINVAYANNAAPGASLQLLIAPLSSSTAKKMVTGTSVMWDNTDNVVLSDAIGGYYDTNTTAVTAIRLIETSGNITSGSCSLYALN